MVTIVGPGYGSDVEPLRAFANVTFFDAEGRTAPQISDELVESFSSDVMIERVDAALGGERAVEMIGVPICSSSPHWVRNTGRRPPTWSPCTRPSWRRSPFYRKVSKFISLGSQRDTARRVPILLAKER